MFKWRLLRAEGLHVRFSVPDEPGMAPEGHDSEPEDFAFTLPPLRGQRFTCTVGEDGMITGLPLVAGTVVLVVVP